ncbi:peptidylprolyl isomerase FKBP-type [Fibrisoma limi BUZ 3]|uniref:Peptidyl-prolyl cis-trans isomerase n=1 Tax=Fibrisoma limi BUZ 3 TaxID=1185876 RepID=I2GH98_9BACT|nr:peptidylprolyl isomerase [Fibrisoma limi]CCH53273.1 peptidylprolyl isomerase FKBP-type [Fibrisoma limi BUZ 3]
MAQAKSGDTVQVHYTGTLTDGTVFDSSEGRTPLEFQLGSGQVIRGFDEGITGMNEGERKTIQIPVEDAYGPANEEMIFTLNRTDIPADIPLEVGMTLNMHEDGNPRPIPVIVRDLTNDSVTLDANHPLAGQDLVFDVELVGVKPSSGIIV